MNAILYYIHDPMCSWCWGYRPTWDQLKAHLPAEVSVQNIAGGLAKDSDKIMPEELQQTLQGYWHQIHELLGTEFNFDFWTRNQPRRSTFMACRAAIAAKNQGYEEAMIDAIQRGYYLRAMNPSNVEVLHTLAAELALKTDLDKAQFVVDLQSQATQQEFDRQMALARALPIDGFPSLLLEIDGQRTLITGDYSDYRVSLNEILKLQGLSS